MASRDTRTLTVRIVGDDRSFAMTVRKVREGAGQMERSLKGAQPHVDQFGKSLRGLFTTSAKIGSLGLAAQGISALGAAGGAAAAGLAPAAGILATYPALASAAGQGIGVFKLATGNLSKAVGGLNEKLDTNSKAFKELDPQAKRIAIRLNELKKPIRDLSGVAQRGLFPGLEDGIKSLSHLLPVARRIVHGTAVALGDLAKQGAGVLASWGPDFATQGARNIRWIRSGGDSAIHLADALRNLTLSAGPLTNWLVKLANAGAKAVDSFSIDQRRSGGFERFFAKTRSTMGDLLKISGNLGRVLAVVFTAAYPVGHRLLGDLTKASDKFAEWAQSAGGRNAIAQYFRDAEPAIRELASLVKDTTVAFFELGRGQQVAPLLRTVRTQLLPAVQAMIASTTSEFMPAFLNFATQSIKLFTVLGGSSGPLVQFTKLMGTILGQVNALIDRVPAIGTVLAGVFAAGGIYKALRLGAALTGVGKLIGLLKTAGGIGAAGGVAGGASRGGGAGGVIGKVVGAAGKERGATPGNPVFVASVTGGLGGGEGVAGKTLGRFAKGTALRMALVEVGAPAAGILGVAFAAHILARNTARNNFPTRGSEPAARAQEGRPARDNRGAFQRVLGDAAPMRNIPALNKMADALDRLSGTGKGGRAPQLKVLSERMRDALRSGDRGKIEATSAALGKLAGNRDDSTSRTLRKLADTARRLAGTGTDDLTQVRHQLGLTRNEFARMSSDGQVSMREIRRAVAINTGRIKASLGNDSEAGRKALAQNFQEAVKAVRGAMRDGRVSTQRGMRAIRDLLAHELQATYGISIKAARHQVTKSTVAGATGGDSPAGASTDFQRGGRLRRAVGGWIGGRDMVSGDMVPIGDNAIAALGEYVAAAPDGRRAVINRHQMPVVEAALGGRVDSFGSHALPVIERALAPLGGLDRLFAMVNRPHMFAGGGFIPAANRLERAHFPYVWGGGHQRTPAPFGPMDCSGAVSYVLQQGGVKIPTMTSGQLMTAGAPGPGGVTVFANPEHTFMRIGSRYFGTSGSNPGGGAGWFPAPPASYLSRFTQRHFAGGANLMDLNIKAPRVRGGGLLGSAVQGALKMAAAGANAAGSRAIASLGVGTGQAGDPGPTGRGAFGKGALAALWRRAGGPSNIANLMAAVALAESGGNPRAHNPSGASGLWQILGVPFAGNVYNPLTNARMAVAKYRSQGLGAWEAYTNGNYRRYLGRGGRVRGFQAGGNLDDMIASYTAQHPQRMTRQQIARAKHPPPPTSYGSQVQGYEIDVTRTEVRQATAAARDNLPSLIKALADERKLKMRRLKRIRKVLKGRITKERRQRLLEEEAQLIGEIADLAASLKEYRADAKAGATTITRADELEAGVDPNAPTPADAAQAAADAQAAERDALAQAQEEANAIQQRLVDATKELKASIDQQNAFASSVAGISSREAVRALSDVISGQIVGVGLQGRRGTAGTGRQVLMP